MAGRQSMANEFYSAHLYGTDKLMYGNPASGRLGLHERMFIRVLTELAANRFKWDNLPDGIDPRFLEMSLFRRALVVFFKDTGFVKQASPRAKKYEYIGTDRYLALRGAGSDGIDYYDNPLSFNVSGPSFNSRDLRAAGKDPECIPIWANMLRVPDLDIVMLYATKLANLEMTIEINTASARRTKVIAVPENMRLSAAQVIKQINEGVPVIEITPAMGEVLTALDLGVEPRTIIDLSVLRQRIWADCMTLLGIDNSNADKKERLVSAEVDANNDQIQSSRNVALNSRKYAVEQINKRWGLEIEVEYNEEAMSQLEGDAAPETLDAGELKASPVRAITGGK